MFNAMIQRNAETTFQECKTGFHMQLETVAHHEFMKFMEGINTQAELKTEVPQQFPSPFEFDAAGNPQELSAQGYQEKYIDGQKKIRRRNIRERKACDECRRQKVRCDVKKPFQACTNCSNKSFDCRIKQTGMKKQIPREQHQTQLPGLEACGASDHQSYTMRNETYPAITTFGVLYPHATGLITQITPPQSTFSMSANTPLSTIFDAASSNTYSNSAKQPPKGYSCPQNACKRTFSMAKNAQRHGRMHTGEGKLLCGVCEKAFTRSDQMTQHQRTH